MKWWANIIFRLINYIVKTQGITVSNKLMLLRLFWNCAIAEPERSHDLQKGRGVEGNNFIFPQKNVLSILIL